MGKEHKKNSRTTCPASQNKFFPVVCKLCTVERRNPDYPEIRTCRCPDFRHFFVVRNLNAEIRTHFYAIKSFNQRLKSRFQMHLCPDFR